MSRSDEDRKMKLLQMRKLQPRSRNQIIIGGGDNLTITLAEAADKLRNAPRITRVDIERDGTLIATYDQSVSLSRAMQNILIALADDIRL